MMLLRRHFKAMGGDNEIVVAASDEAPTAAAIENAIGEVLRIERKYSRYRQDSVLSQINRSAGQKGAVLCDEETTWLLDFADSLYSQSNGLFDITSGILRKAWDFSKHSLPMAETLEASLKQVGWDKVERVGNSIRLPRNGMEIDFGGFGKEYASDRAAAVLAQAGIAHGYVNLGGDINVLGPQADGQPWLIGIQNPRQRGAVIATIPITCGALATSGDYEKYFDLDGKRYCHILKPETGYPVSYWSSISVMAPLAIVAGSYSTIAMLKEGAALPFLQESQVQYLAIDLLSQISTNKTHIPE